MNKRIFLCIIIIICSMDLFSQPSWHWVKSAGSNQNDYANAVATDNSRNLYLTGNFGNTIVFGSNMLYNSGSMDVFLTKYDSSGNVIWAKSAGGPGTESAYDVTTDPSGNIITTGYFASPSITFGTITLNRVGTYDMYLVKYDAAGNAIWAKNFGNTNITAGYGVRTDALGNIYITGQFSGASITFGLYTLTNHSNAVDMFTIKCDPAGNVLWAKGIGGNGNDNGNKITLDAAGNIYVNAWYESPSIIIGTDTIHNHGLLNSFIVKYTPTGNAIWVRSFGGTIYEYAYGIDADSYCNIYVSGNMTSPKLFTDADTLNSLGSNDAFILKFDSAGNYIYGKTEGGSNFDMSYDLTIDAADNVFMTGIFTSNPAIIGGITLPNSGSYDAFVVKYDAAGNALWTKKAGSTLYDTGQHLAVDSHGTVYVAGWFDSPTLQFDATTLNTQGGTDIFLAAIDTLCHFVPVVNNPDICLGDTAILTAGTCLTYHWSTGETTSSISVHPGSNTSYLFTGTFQGCIGQATANVSVHTPPSVTLGSFNDVCYNEPPFNIAGGSPNGGIYSGPGISGNIFTAGDAGAGSHQIIYTFQDGFGCPGLDSSSITVHSLPIVSFSGLYEGYCINYPADILTGVPPGGTFSGPGITNSLFDPTTAGTGVIVINYSYTDGNNCTNTATDSTLVDLCTGIIHDQEKPGISILPNPNHGNFIIANELQHAYDLTMINSMGQAVYKGSNSRVIQRAN